MEYKDKRRVQKGNLLCCSEAAVKVGVRSEAHGGERRCRVCPVAGVRESGVEAGAPKLGEEKPCMEVLA